MGCGSEPDITKDPVITAEPEKGKPTPDPEIKMEPIEGTSKTFNSGSDFGMDKLSKYNELNESMSIASQERDDYETKLFNIGGTN